MIKVGVIFGGESVEHEVSIISAVQAMNKLDNDKYEIIPIYEEDILSIDIEGNISKSEFEAYRTSFYSDFYTPYDDYYTYHEELLLEMCGYFGVDEEDITALLEYGYTSEEIEDMLMDLDLLHQTVRDIQLICSKSAYEECCGVF